MPSERGCDRDFFLVDSYMILDTIKVFKIPTGAAPVAGPCHKSYQFKVQIIIT